MLKGVLCFDLRMELISQHHFIYTKISEKEYISNPVVQYHLKIQLITYICNSIYPEYSDSRKLLCGPYNSLSFHVREV